MATKDKLIEYRTINIKAIIQVPDIKKMLKVDMFICLDDKITEYKTGIASFGYNLKGQVLSDMPRGPGGISNPCQRAVEYLQHYTDQIAYLTDLRKEISNLYGGLTNRQQEVFLDYYVLGKTEQETAEKIGINISTVSRILATIKNTPSFN
jgi:RNA polymerase sigma factor (sigma-70 family)